MPSKQEEPVARQDQNTLVLGMQGWEIINNGIHCKEDGLLVIGITPIPGKGYGDADAYGWISVRM